MPMFICDTCSGIENTALGTAWDRATGAYTGLLVKDHAAVEALCSECTPPEKAFRGKGGVWHGEFPKEIATEEIVRARGHWLERSDREGVPRGFIHFGKFEYLRPEIEHRMKLAVRRARYKKNKSYS